MALMGLPSGSAGGDILARIQYDAKAGKWHRVDRSQNASGDWVSDMLEMDKGDMFIMDMPSIEVGWIAFTATGPDFQMVPNGQQVGPKPTDQHKAGFRVHVLLPREEAPRTFAATAKSVIGVIDELHTKAGAAKPGEVPVVKIAGTRMVETKGPAGTTRNYAPLLEIVKFVPKPGPLGGSTAAAPAPASPPPVVQPAPVAGGSTGAALDDAIPFAAEAR